MLGGTPGTFLRTWGATDYLASARRSSPLSREHRLHQSLIQRHPRFLTAKVTASYGEPPRPRRGDGQCHGVHPVPLVPSFSVRVLPLNSIEGASMSLPEGGRGDRWGHQDGCGRWDSHDRNLRHENR